MSSVKANAKWLVALACGVLLAEAASGLGDVKNNQRPRTEARDVRELSSVFRDVAKRARSAMVTISTTGKPVVQRGLPFNLEEDSPLRELPQFRQFMRQR